MVGALKIASVSASIVTQCVSPSYRHCRAAAERCGWNHRLLVRRSGLPTFLQHGDAQVLLALRMSAAHHGLRSPLLCAVVVTHRQNLDLAVVLLESQAVHRCRATNPTDDISVQQNQRCLR